jgi:hypothetical protein
MNRLSREIALCALAENHGVQRPTIRNALYTQIADSIHDASPRGSGPAHRRLRPATR